jgi:tRNA(Ile)-lysidine synthase
MMDVQAAAAAAISDFALFDPGAVVVVGVSGGADSLCLLHVLCHLPPTHAPRIHVAHLHHGVRGAEADADAAFVADLAAAWNLPCTIGRVDVPAAAGRGGLSVEEAGRRARYTFLGEVALANGSDTVAVAHNADDQVETILMHFLRGSGLSGLRGMLPLSPLPRPPWGRAVVDSPLDMLAGAPDGGGLRLARPLLDVPRLDIEAYCQEHGLTPRVDRTNLDVTLFRNRLRHELLPLLETYNPGVRAALRRSAQVISDEQQALRQMLAALWPQVVTHGDSGGVTFVLATWRQLQVAWQRSLLREAIHRLRPGLRDVGFEHVERARRLLVSPACATGQRVTLPRGLALTVGYTTFTVAAADARPDDRAGPQLVVPSLPVIAPGVTCLPSSGWRLEAEIRRPDELPSGWQTENQPWRAFLDADVVGPAPVLRPRQPGDWLHPLGLGGRRTSLNAFMINHKLPAALRSRWPLLIGTQGLAWLCGLRIDHHARVQPTTQRVLCLTWRYAASGVE